MELLPPLPESKRKGATLRAQSTSGGIRVGGYIKSQPTEAERKESGALILQIRTITAALERSASATIRALEKKGLKSEPHYRGGFRKI